MTYIALATPRAVDVKIEPVSKEGALELIQGGQNTIVCHSDREATIIFRRLESLARGKRLSPKTSLRRKLLISVVLDMRSGDKILLLNEQIRGRNTVLRPRVCTVK